MIRKKDSDSEQPSSLVHTATQKAQQNFIKSRKDNLSVHRVE